MAKGQTAPPDGAGRDERHRRLTPKGEATRARLVEVATEVFVSQGYGAASVRDIARRSGLSSGAIYGTFRGKAELLVEAVDARIASDIESLPPDVTDRTLPDIDGYQFAHAADRDEVRALLLEAAAAARTDPEVRDRLRDTILPRIDVATDAHEEWRDRAGVSADVDMRALVTLLWAADLGLGVLEAMGIDSPSPDAWGELIRRLLTSLEAPDAKPGKPTTRPLRPPRGEVT